jgi:hypothetical protein
MTRRASLVRRLARSDSGFTIVEMLVATAIMVTITGAIFGLLNPATGIFHAQPEVSDMQQRLRVGADSLEKDILMAGAGTYVGAGAGALYNFFAPVMPYRSGTDSDPKKGVFYRPDTISILYVPPSPAQTTLRQDMPQPSAELKVEPENNCGDKHDALCGFEEGMTVIIFDSSGSLDWMKVTNVQDEALHLQHNEDQLSTQYTVGANITQVAMHTYYLKTDVATNTYQMMHYDGWKTDTPVVDNVVDLKFEYFGEPQPPQLLPNAVLANTNKGPWTTYGPRPPALGVDVESDTWGAGENCTFTVSGGMTVPRLPVLGDGVSQQPLTAEMVQDGPWCPDATKVNRYDADLLRIRRVRVTLRVQVAQATLRGPAGVLFTHGGTSQGGERYVPDQQLRFDITPRNMNLGR